MTTIGSLCTGYGGLDLAAEQLTGGRTAWVADVMPAASRLLAYRYPDVPNLGDFVGYDWSTVAPVDILTAGWPCQPFSLAGKRKGAADVRAIWPAVARAVCELRPARVLLENVAAIVTAGELARALGDLAALGYDADWLCLRASDVGAPHPRNRCFLAATPADAAGRGRDRWAYDAQRGQVGRATPAGGSPGVAPDPDDERRSSGRAVGPLPKLTATEGGRRAPAEARGATTPDADRAGGEARRTRAIGEGRAEKGRGEPVGDRAGVEWAPYGHAVETWASVIGRPAPHPTAMGRRGGQQLSARFVEWMMGLPDGWVTDVPGLTRNQQLTLLGNGVVPQQAVAAYRELLSHFDSSSRITDDTSMPLASAFAETACHISSGTRTVRRGVCVSDDTSGDDEARVEMRDRVRDVLADDEVNESTDGHGVVPAGAGDVDRDGVGDRGRTHGVCHDTNVTRVMTPGTTYTQDRRSWLDGLPSRDETGQTPPLWDDEP
jgi:DNA (cytosine-5)-methyltransferase 1